MIRLVTVASGAAAGRFLNYEPGGPGVGVQTAYGMEVEVCSSFLILTVAPQGIENMEDY